MLLIDSGNSSIKCRLLQPGQVSNHAFDLYRQGAWQRFGEFIQALEVKKIYLASVARADIQQKIRDQIEQSSRASFQQLNTLPQLGGVNNGYGEYQQLGVDRWLAVLGASEFSAHDAIIIDAGSAITIDLLSQRDGHLGGAILPGFHCDRTRFEQLFPAIDFTQLPDMDDVNPGRSTRACLRPQALPASAERIHRIIEQWCPLLDEPVEILLCGQDADKVARGLSRPHRVVPDLVFTGMLKQIACLG